MSVENGHKLHFSVGHARKAHENRDKHDVAFDEAATVFRDSKALSIFDPDHSETEDRWITMGISEKGRLLVVIHTFREGSEDAVHDENNIKPDSNKKRNQKIR